MSEINQDNLTPLQRTPDNTLRCGRCSAVFAGNGAQGTMGRNFEETEPEFRAALVALDYMNFDTGMETVRDDAAEIAVRIAAIYAAREEVVEGMYQALKAIYDCYGLGLSAQNFLIQVAPFIQDDARAGLTVYAQLKEQK